MERRTYGKATQGSTAYATQQNNIPKNTPSPQRKPRPSQKPLTRKKVQVREADFISIDAIVGFIIVGVLSAMVMICYAKLATFSDEVVQLRKELQDLENKKVLLSA